MRKSILFLVLTVVSLFLLACGEVPTLEDDGETLTTAGDTGTMGPVGPEGPQGPVGPQGPEGPQGPKGDQGTQGIAGPPGATGPQGPVGVGSVGPQGVQGPMGPQGMTGAVGPAGGLDVGSVYIQPAVLMATGNQTTLIADCNGNDIAIGGGCDTPMTGTSRIAGCVPWGESGSAPTGWRGDFLTSPSTNVRVYAVCVEAD